MTDNQFDRPEMTRSMKLTAKLFHEVFGPNIKAATEADVCKFSLK